MTRRELRQEVIICRVAFVVGAIWFLLGAFKLVPVPNTAITTLIAFVISYGWLIGGIAFMVIEAAGSYSAKKTLQRRTRK